MDKANIADVANNAVDKIDARFGELLDKLGVTAQYLWPKMCEYVVYKWMFSTILAVILLIIGSVLLIKRGIPTAKYEEDITPSLAIGTVLSLMGLFATIVMLSQAWIPFCPEIAALQAIANMVSQ